jgi:alpha-mannosidase
MARRQPATLALLREALDADRATLIGGEYDELELPLLTPEGILDQLRRGLASYQRHLGRRPTIFGRRRFGLTPLLPQILRQLGFVGALHFTLDDGRFPVGNQSKLRWEGLDGTEMESLARIPFEVLRPDRYLRLAERLGDTADLDHASTAIFAHWPGQSSPWYDDLWRMAQYGPALGRFKTLAQYFESTTYAGRSERYSADKYVSPYLAQDVDSARPDPISRWVRYHRQSEMAHRAQALSAMTEVAGGTVPHQATGEDSSAAPASPEPDQATQPDRRLEQAMASLAALVSGPPAAVSQTAGWLLANPRNFTWRECLDVSQWDALPAVSGAVVEAAEAAGHKQVLVDVPAMGFAWVGPAPGDPSSAAQKKPRKKEDLPALAQGNVLKNEHLEVTVSPVTGGIQAIHNSAVRANRLGQQVAMRLARPRRAGAEGGDEEQDYSIMAADEVSVEEAGPFVGRIRSRGRLMDRQGQRVARFVQTTEIRRASRILELRIDLDVDRQPEPEPWGSYYAVRFAWTDETVQTYRNVGLASQSTETAFVESPLWFDISGTRARMTILTAGLPYHRRFGLRKLDTLLVVRGETARSFRLGIGMDLAHPAPAALGFLAGGLPRVPERPPHASPSGWFFHVDVRGVVATHWEPVLADGKPAGFRVRLLETEGRQVQVGLRAFRSLGSSRKLDLLGEGPTDLPVQDDRTTLDLGPYQWADVEAHFAGGK